MTIKILQYNIQSLTANNNKQLLELFLVNNNIDIAILSEIWVSNNSRCSLANYNFVCKPRNDGYGGVGIYLKKHIRFRQINCDIRLEVIGIRTINLINNINIFSVYAAPSTDISSFQQGCDDLFTIDAQSSGLTVIGCDFNAKSSIWGNNTQDRKFPLTLRFLLA